MVFLQKLLEKACFFFKLTSRAMDRPAGRPASSDKWKEPLVNPFTANNSLRTQTYFRSSLLSSVFAGYANKSQSQEKIPNFVSENPGKFRTLSADAKVRMSNNVTINQSRRERVTVPLYFSAWVKWNKRQVKKFCKAT